MDRLMQVWDVILIGTAHGFLIAIVIFAILALGWLIGPRLIYMLCSEAEGPSPKTKGRRPRSRFPGELK